MDFHKKIFFRNMKNQSVVTTFVGFIGFGKTTGATSQITSFSQFSKQ